MAATDEVRDGPDLLIGEVIGGKYQVVSFMDRGAIGAVYKAVQLSIGREVVLKVLQPSVSVFEADPNFAERFRREAATYGKLRHPNTVTLFEYGEHVHQGRTLYYMAMEYVRGRTLRQVMKDTGRFPVDRAIDVTLQVVRSLREAHGLGIVHRDLKPGNVMVAESEEGERIKVLDFGVAKVAKDDDTGEDDLTRTGTLLGSPHYMAPEQIRVGTVDGRTDIYALGCILFEMLAGAPPFRGNGVIETCAAHLTKPVPSMDSVTAARLGPDGQATAQSAAVPPALEAIVRRCLEKRPEQRFQTVDDLAAALKQLRDGADLGSLDRARTAVPASTGRSWGPALARKAPVVWLAVGLLVAGIPAVLLGVTLLVAVMWIRPPSTTEVEASDPVAGAERVEVGPSEPGDPSAGGTGSQTGSQPGSQTGSQPGPQT
ncbi:MAG: serine/threonine-protein kinase, partial [Myxococcota bacterium]